MPQDSLSHHSTRCHMCGLPSSSWFGPGTVIKIKTKAENRFQRTRTISVPCCSPDCALQSLAISDMGPATHKWPISLAEYFDRIQSLEGFDEGPARTETPSESSENTGAGQPENRSVDLDHVPRVSVRRKGGRPRKWNSEAERLRAHRNRQRESRLELIPPPGITEHKIEGERA
jgi:hypothetical protein